MGAEFSEFIKPPGEPFYDPRMSYYQNYTQGPFGAFADGTIYEQKDEPQFRLLDQEVHLPFGIPSGPLLNSTFIKAALEKGFDVVTYKTVRSKAVPAHLSPNVLAVHTPVGELTPELGERGVIADQVYSHPLSITNSFGVPSWDPDVWQPDVKKALIEASRGQMVIISFQGTTDPEEENSLAKDFGKTARLVKETGARIVEMNSSCPNEGTNDFLCNDIDKTWYITSLVRHELGEDIRLLVKIGYFKDKEKLKYLMSAIGGMIDGVSVVNSLPARIYKDYTRTEPALRGSNRLYSGVSGAAIKWAGLEMVRSLREIREELGQNFDIFGMGGVQTREDYLEYRQAGADCVMSATGSMWDPYLAQRIKRSLGQP